MIPSTTSTLLAQTMVTVLLILFICTVNSITLDATTSDAFITVSTNSNTAISGTSWSITTPSTSYPNEWGLALHLSSDKYGFQSDSSISTISIKLNGWCNTGECDVLYGFGVENKYIAFMHDFDGGVRPYNTANPLGGVFIAPHCHSTLHSGDIINIFPPTSVTNYLPTDIRLALSNGNNENWETLTSIPNYNVWPVQFDITNDNINDISILTFYSPTFPNGIECIFNESFPVNKDFKFGIIPDVNDESFTIEQININNINTGQFSFGFFVGVSGVNNARSSGTLTMTLYWDLNIYQCVLTPSKGNAWILCDSNHNTFIFYEECLTEPEYKMHLSLPSDDGLWIDKLIINQYNMNYTFDIFCSLLNFKPTNTETTNCTEWDIPQWSWICMDIDNNCNQYQSLDITFSDTNQVFVETPQSNNAYIPNLCKMSTLNPIILPTISPTLFPTLIPTKLPTISPTLNPTISPTLIPTISPTLIPTKVPSNNPSIQPIKLPTIYPTQ
eukprot:499391_1